MTKALKDLTNSELVDVYNSYAGPLDSIKNWKGKKSILIERIIAIKPTPAPNTIRACAIDILCQVAYYEDRTKDPSPENHVKKSHKEARSVGLPYDEIIHVIQDEFPECKTSIACLRWYAVKIRIGDEGYSQFTMPQRRPRVKAAKKLAA